MDIRLNKISSFLLFVLLLPLQELKADDLASENRRIIDAFLEHKSTDPNKVREVLQKTVEALKPESLRFDGAATSIPNTRVRVKGDNPPCGQNNMSAQEQLGRGLFDFGLKVMLGGALLPDPTGIGSTVLAILGGTISLIGKAISTDPSQEVANCALACAAIPGTYQKAELAPMINVSYIYTRGDGAAPRKLAPFDNGDWFVSGDWVVDHVDLQVGKSTSAELFGSTLIKQGNQEYGLPTPTDNEILCPVTLVCVQGKNWSHNLSRSLALSVITDIRQISVGACLDASMVNKAVYHDEFVKALPNDFIQTYYAEKREQMRSQAAPN